MNPPNRRGDDQPRILLFVFIAAAFTGIIAMIIFLVVSASLNTSKAVLSDQENAQIYSSSVVSSLGTVLNLRYSDTETASCIRTDGPNDFQRPVTLTMRFKSNNVPDRCDFFVNGALTKSERRIETDCTTNCPFSEFNRQFSLGTLDYRDTHIVRVCCNDICVEKTLERICAQ